MVGTEKQVKWATDIISKVYAKIDENIANCERLAPHIKSSAAEAEMYRIARARYDKLFSDPRMTAAKIIDTQNSFPDAEKLVLQAKRIAFDRETNPIDEMHKLCGI